MTALQNLAFRDLLSAWRRREEARESAQIADLAAARMSLEGARTYMQTSLHSGIR
jgi:hypothetical protein